MDIRLDMLPYEHIRWIENTDLDLDRLGGNIRHEKDQGSEGPAPAAVCQQLVRGMVLDRNPGLQLSEFGR